MRVLALGGAGGYGKSAVTVLASSSLVSEIVIAGRNLEAAQACARRTGEKARAVALDVSDRGKLAALARDADVIVNTTGPEYETVMKVLDAAIDAGTNYCDIGADGPTTEIALKRDPGARANGVTALLGIGACPGVTTLMMLHAARQLDTVEKVRSCGFFPAAAFGITKDEVRSYRETGRVSTGWRMTMKWSTPPFPAYQGGAQVTVKNEAEEMRVAMPGDGEVSAVMVGSPEAVTLPRWVPGIQDVYTLVSWFPFQLNEHFRELGGQAARGKLSETQAVLAFLDRTIEELDRGQPSSAGLPGDGTRWVEAFGTKSGSRRRYTCWPSSNWYGLNNNPTPTALALAALKILGGEIRARGVLTPESCLDPLPFFKEVACQMLKTDEPGNLLNESWQAP